MNRKKYPLAALCIVSILLSALNCPLIRIVFDDKEIFRYIGMLICRGGVPYRDVFDHKPPLIYFLNAWGVWAGPWGFWIVDCLLVLLATVSFYRVCRDRGLSRPWLPPLLFNLLLRQTIVAFGIGMTREYTAIFLLLFFCLLPGVGNDRGKYKYLAMGFLAGLTFWMQQDALLPLLPFLAYALFAGAPGNTKKVDMPRANIMSRAKTMLPAILAMAVGFLAVTIPLLAFFAGHHALHDLWDDAFVFNGRLSRANGSLTDNLKILKTALHLGEYDLTFYTALILGLAALRGRHGRRRLLTVALSATLLSFGSEFLSGRLLLSMDFIYYLLPLAALIPILVFLVFAWGEEPYIREPRAQAVFGMILCILPLLAAARTLSTLKQHYRPTQEIAANAPFGSAVPELEYLQRQPLRDYQLYVFDDPNLVYAYNRFGILSPSKWIYHYFWNWYPGWDEDGNILRSIMTDLEKHRTTYILDCPDRDPVFMRRPAYAVWKSFLRTAYTPIMTDSSKNILWKIR